MEADRHPRSSLNAWLGKTPTIDDPLMGIHPQIELPSLPKIISTGNNSPKPIQTDLPVFNVLQLKTPKIEKKPLPKSSRKEDRLKPFRPREILFRHKPSLSAQRKGVAPNILHTPKLESRSPKPIKSLTSQGTVFARSVQTTRPMPGPMMSRRLPARGMAALPLAV